MGRLNMDIFNFLSKEELRVLSGIELGMRNHELVPVSLIKYISGLSSSNASINKILRELNDKRLVAREQAGGDFGYKLLVSGYDFLALKALVKQKHVSALGNQVGVGKESDVYIGLQPEEKEVCLKLHRLGRTSFRQVKNKRDYLRHRRNTSWLYMSRLSAETEIIIMKALFDAGFPVPKPIAHNRHVVVMEYFNDAVPLYQVKELNDPHGVYGQIISILKRFLERGLVHGDFNEFNLLITLDEDEKEIVRVIDFPQMVSRNHRNARQFYNRDAQCIYSFFQKKFDIVSTTENNIPSIADFDDVVRTDSMDIRLKLSGYLNDPDNTEDLHEVESDQDSDHHESDNSGNTNEESESDPESEDPEDDEKGDENSVSGNEIVSNSCSNSCQASSSSIKTSIGARRKGYRNRRTQPMSAEEVRLKVKREADKQKRRNAAKVTKKEIRADRNSTISRHVREDLDFGGEL